MKRGLVIGKFMPLHRGHMALIEFAAGQCDELIVSMTYAPDDAIPGPMRFEWIKEEFKDRSNIKPEISLDDFDNESLSWDRRIPLWSAFLKKRFPPLDAVFCSAAYGDSLAKALGIIHISFDPDRKKFPVSGTLIRQRPFSWWNMIAPAARGFFVKKICFYGPESTGKSTLARQLAEKYHTVFVPEVSRELITSNVFSVEDIIKIGHVQTERVIDFTEKANKILLCDTDVITTEIYSYQYLHVIPPVLFELEKKVSYDRYYLFDIDVPWVADEIRDLGEKRVEMFNVFKSELEKRKIPFTLVRGSYGERESFLSREIDSLLGN